MEFKQLESFVAVVRHNSFTKAAEVLYTSQPTVSNHIRQLEEELNAPLINRTTKAVEVTPRGWEAYEMACSILEQRNRLLSRWAGRTQYAIHLGTTAIPSAYILPEVLTAYREAHADTEFVIQQSDAHRVLEGLLDGTFDLGLLEYPISEERLSCIPFFQDHTVMITPATDRFRALQAQPGSHWKALLQEPIILRDHDNRSLKGANRYLQRLGVREEDLNITARIANQDSIKHMVAGGLGVSFLSQLSVRQFQEAEKLLVFPLPEQASRRSLYLACRRNQALPPHHQSFIRFLRGYYADAR